MTENQTRIIKSTGKYLCRKHYLQLYRHGKIISTIYDENEIVHNGDTAEIILKDKYSNPVSKALIDIEDVGLVSGYKWHSKTNRNNTYAVSSLPDGRKLFLHRLILGYDGDMDVDHIDHNGLNNRKNNLRIISHSKNIMNQNDDWNGVKKVPSGRYAATISVNGKSIHIGTFDTFEEAKEARLNYEINLI